ncbi:MAG: sensor histidine kinase [Proteobacteria bacterium]|nr:sensor histidine kinase [Pseudomonadota bacterium]
MNPTFFDREWNLPELLDAAALERIGPALAQMLGGNVAIFAADGAVLWGQAEPEARREALVLELEAIGFLSSSTADPFALHGARHLLQTLLGAESRYKMASSLHLEATAEDYQALQRGHARLLESEARYKALAESLEEKVAEQVDLLDRRQNQLFQAAKLASVGQLAAGVAHEINNPLGFIRSNLGTLGNYVHRLQQYRVSLDSCPPSWSTLDLDFALRDATDILKECETGIVRIASIVRDLKFFSSVDRAEEEVVDLNESLRQAFSILQGQLPPGIQIRLVLLPLPTLRCQCGHLNQAFLGILRNGIQAIVDAKRPGEVVIRSEADDECVTLRFQDNGVGMTPEEVQRVFEPFYTTREIGVGTGLGLSSARSAVLAHRGNIFVTSQPDGGATVTITLPLS